MQVIGVKLCHYFGSLPKSLVYPSTQTVTPSLYRSSQVEPKNSVNRRRNSLENPQHRIRQVKKQAGYRAYRVSKHVSDKICHCGNQVVNKYPSIGKQIEQCNK